MTSHNQQLTDQVVQIIENLFINVEKPIALHEPSFSATEIEYVENAIKSTYVSSVGEYISKFENEIGRITGSKYVIAVSSGTAALEVALSAAGVKPETEVIVPTLSFVATANAVSNIGAFPYFVDSEPISLGMCPEKLEKVLSTLVFDKKNKRLINSETNRAISAIVPMHTLGHPCQIESLIQVATKYGIPVVEDAAESLGSFKHLANGERKHTGTFGVAGVLSFNGNKVITTGGGGAILTDNENLAVLARKLSNTAKIPHAWEYQHEITSHNYRMPNLNAALGFAQIEKLQSFLEKKRKIASYYENQFSNLDEVSFLSEPAETTSNYWLSAIRLNEGDLKTRNEILNRCVENEVYVRPLWDLLSNQPMYRSCQVSDISNAIKLHSTVICLPSSAILSTYFEN